MRIVALLFFMLFSGEALACSCVAPSENIAHYLSNAGAVFVGRVTKVEKGIPDSQVVFKVEKAWRGVDKSQITILTAGSDGMCRGSPQFQTDKNYLVFTDGGLKISSGCNPTISLDVVSPELQAQSKDLKQYVEDREKLLAKLGEPTVRFDNN